MRTSVEGVYALGDVIGRYSFTHSAAFEAQYLSRKLLQGETEPIEYGHMPHAVFSHPEVAGIGATEQDLRADGVDYRRASLPYTTAAKGRAIKEEHGLCKFLLAPSGEILGFHVVGRDASILLHQVIPVMKWRNHISSITGIIHVHPSLPEVVRNTARKAAALVDSN
jgi:dihydrolipoamide dehydrogenase